VFSWLSNHVARHDVTGDHHVIAQRMYSVALGRSLI
jgi:hypothetical protein